MRFGPQRRTYPLIAIAVAAVLFLVISYQYSSTTLSQINQAALEGIHSNAQVQVSDASEVLVAKVDGIAAGVQVISTSAETNGISTIPSLLAAAQASNGGFTSSYFWMGSNGSLLALNNGTTQNVASYAGSNYSQRPYFEGAKHYNVTYFTGAVPSLTNASIYHIFISRAVYTVTSGGAKTFNGVIGAAIDLRTLGAYLKTQVSPGLGGQFGMTDANATILYSDNASLIGQNYFSAPIQAAIPAGLAASLGQVINQSLKGTSGFSDIPVQGTDITIAYSPVLLQGTASAGGSEQFGALYYIVPDTIEGSNSLLISQLRILSSLIIIGIAGISTGATIIFIGWNRRLDDTVKERTSELTVANEQLKAYAQSQTDFVNIAAHELRTPTQSILGYTEILQDAAKKGPGPLPSASTMNEAEVRDALNSISNNAKRLKKLTDDILSVSRIDENRLTLSKETFDLNDQIREVIPEVDRAMSVGGKMGQAKFEFEQTEPSLLVTADSSKIHEVLTNLLTNAVRFSDGRGVITVRAGKTDKGEAIVSVKDRGKGIDPEVLPRLFKKFVTTSPSGSGLGLFIASRLVEAHGGRMWAENNGPGEPGSTFTFTIPLGGGADRPARPSN